MNKAFSVAMVLMLTACASGKAFENVRLGMTKAEVVRAAGQPDGVVAANSVDGNAVEVVEYRRGGLWWGDLDESFWFFFNNDKLEKWGRPGDHLRYVE